MRNKNRNDHVKKNKSVGNQGFSLVELLVAVTILAIIAIPFLHSFVTAARTNAKAKKVMNATTAAQNVFEELKGEELSQYLNTYHNTQSPLKDASGNPIYDKSGKPIQSYQVTIPSVTVNGRDYRARVTLDPDKYTARQGETVDSTDYNSADFATLVNMSPSCNAFYIQQESDDMLAAKALDETHMDDLLGEYMSRTITIDIDYNSGTKLTKVYATLTYTDKVAGTTYTAMDKAEIYSNATMLSNELSNIFICFLPMYNGNVAYPNENIVINNTSNCPVGVYLVKETGRDAKPYYVGMKTMNGCHVKLTVNEGEHEFIGPVTQISTNLAYGSSLAVGAKELDVSYTGITDATGKSIEEIFDMDSLQRMESSERIYKVKIEVFDGKDTAYEKVLTTMEGTKTE